jgi:pyruvate/2-oxoglutarate dehydrogenase complex dihydrolipoamide dehydrogenase (E3) component
MNGAMSASDTLAATSVDTCIIGDDPGGSAVALAVAAAGLSVIQVRPARQGLTGQDLARRLVTLRRADPAHGWSATMTLITAAGRATDAREHSRRLTAAGIRVVAGEARFTGPRTLTAGGLAITARRFVLATGSAAAPAPWRDLPSDRLLTPDTIWDLATVPARLAVVGDDGTAAALAQACRRFGASVSLFARGGLLPGLHPDRASALRARLVADGIDLFEDAEIIAVETEAAGLEVTAKRNGEADRLRVTHLLYAGPREPRLDGLGLDAAGIARDGAALRTDAALRTTNRHVLALGELTGPADAGLSLRQAPAMAGALLFGRSVGATDILPVTAVQTRPAAIEIGLSDREARSRDKTSRLLRVPLADSDLPGAGAGHLSLVFSGAGRVIGAGILADDPEPLAASLALAIGRKLSVQDLAAIQLPYPAVSDLVGKAVAPITTARLSNHWTRRIIRLMRMVG